jgi:Putative auto-transporter adhesin, head GIN domain
LQSLSCRLNATVASRTLLVSALASALVACNQDGLKGSGNLKTDTRVVTGFTQIALASIGDVTLSQTGTESLTIEAEDNLLPHLRSAVSGGRLTLDTDTSLRPTKPVHYTITVKDLTGVDVSGAGNLTGTQLHANAIKIRISGAGDVSLSGQAESQDIGLSGAGNYDAAKLATKTAKVVIDGAGNAVVHATDAVDAKLSGVGNIDYIGDPKVTQSVSGVGAVRKR